MNQKSGPPPKALRCDAGCFPFGVGDSVLDGRLGGDQCVTAARVHFWIVGQCSDDLADEFRGFGLGQ